MRATLTVSAPEGPSKPCKVTVKLWDVPRPLLRKLARACDNQEGAIYRRGLLDDAVDVVCNSSDKSVTLVRPPADIHGLQARFEELVGKPLAYRMRPLQDAARQCATDGRPTTQEGNLSGCSVEDLFNTIYHAVASATTPPQASAKKQRKSKKKRRGIQVATAA